MFRFRPSSDGILARIPVSTKGNLYVSPMPFGPYDPGNRLLKLYRRHRIKRAVLLVTDEELHRKAGRNLLLAYETAGIAVIRQPIADLTCPDTYDIDILLPRIEAGLGKGNLAIHCNAGVGRTGVVACCLVKHLRQCTGDDAIAVVKECMHTNLTTEQVRFVRVYGQVSA